MGRKVSFWASVFFMFLCILHPVTVADRLFLFWFLSEFLRKKYFLLEGCWENW